jgi:hypothetical protein
MTISYCQKNRNLIFSIVCIFAFIILGATETFGQNASTCPGNPSGYTVSAIRIQTPLSFSKTVRQNIEKTINNAPSGLRVKQPFSLSAQTATLNTVREIYDVRNDVPTYLPVKLQLLAYSKIKNCDNAARTLEAHYYIYLPNIIDQVVPFISTGSNLGEKMGIAEKKEGAKRGAVSTALTRFLAFTNPRPFFGYNGARDSYAGGGLTLPVGNPLINKIQLSGSGSQQSRTANFFLKGSRRTNLKFPEEAEWSGGYSYSEIPSTINNLKNSNGFGQFIGSTELSARLNFLLRYGILLEGGNKQADFDFNPLPNGILTSADYKSLKLFTGASFQGDLKLFSGRQYFEASYGFEIGGVNTGDSYRKNIFDSRYSARFLPYYHRPLDIEARFNTGALHQNGAVPLETRFRGGNVEKNFIYSEQWIIGSNPFIRSFPENRFLPAGQPGTLGGDNFKAFNLTASIVAYGRPMIPIEKSDRADFDAALATQLDISELLLYENYLIERAAPLRDFAERMLQVQPTVVSVRQTLKELSNLSGADDGALREAYKMAIGEICNTEYTLNQIALSLKKNNSVNEVCDITAVDDGRTLVWMDSLLLRYESESGEILESDLYYFSDALQRLIQKLEASGLPLSRQINRLKADVIIIETYRQSACRYACLKDNSTDAANSEAVIDLGNNNFVSNNLASDDGTVLPVRAKPLRVRTNQSGAASSLPASTIPPSNALCPSPCTVYVDAQTESQLQVVRRKSSQEAKRLVDFSGKLSRRFAAEENLYAIGPVFFLDAGKISAKPQFSPGSSPIRFGIGVGGRLTLTGFSADFGYSFNTKRRAGEPRGAFVFSINVTDLLR